ncbi:Detected protein of confused Function [Hibiscus syriacus]|uniref:Detected protein of confused Function n=1 Tax=Hibiscus syriacus TaxID=106335 RepID=A0A6A3D248_HIBSY|nr:Detected protein of confused Function [Hibiscus syriacus]
MKFGRPDTEFMKWRWKPDECQLPLFDAAQFLEIARGKSMAFVGDSVARNQMESLLCLLAHVSLGIFGCVTFIATSIWSPFLVKSRVADINGNSRNGIFTLYLDEADEEWSKEIEKLDYVIVWAVQWFFGPMLLYQNDRLVGCYNRNQNNITSISMYHANRTAFETLVSRNNYTSTMFLRTFSAAHYENGEWDKGGNCGRTRPFT